jgi:hypothetical protein
MPVVVAVVLGQHHLQVKAALADRVAAVKERIIQAARME